MEDRVHDRATNLAGGRSYPCMAPKAGSPYRFVHFTTVAQKPRLFEDAILAEWTFRAFERQPGFLFGFLMPNHPHLIHRVRDPARAQVTFERILGHVSRKAGFGRKALWKVAQPQVLPDRFRALRMLRYVAVNRCRAGLDRDPLEAPFSSYRDVVGARAEPAVTADRLAAAFGKRGRGFARWFHGYVSRDEQVRRDGTPFPERTPTSGELTVGLREIARAATVATRGQIGDLRRRTLTRRVFLGLAWDQGTRDARRLAQVAGISVRAVYDHLRRARPEHVDAGARCLGDARLSSPGFFTNGEEIYGSAPGSGRKGAVGARSVKVRADRGTRIEDGWG